jgi:hypothetical protein
VSALRPAARRRLAFAGGLLLVATLPLLGRWARSGQGERCSWDGVSTQARYRARLVDAAGAEEALCCLCCLDARLATLRVPPRRVVVTDETTKAEVEAEAGWYVDSSVMTNPSTHCRVHVFASEDDARRHALTFHGMVVGRGLAALHDAQRRIR